jgi:TonB family protein
MKTVTTQRMVDGRSSHRAATSNADMQLHSLNRTGYVIGALLVAAMLLAIFSKAYAQDTTELKRAQLSSATVQLLSPIEHAKPLNLSEAISNIRYPRVGGMPAEQVNVVAELYVNKEGRVEHYRVDGTSNARFNKAVADQMLALRFEPARAGDRPIAAYVTIPFVFVLR